MYDDTGLGKEGKGLVPGKGDFLFFGGMIAFFIVLFLACGAICLSMWLAAVFWIMMVVPMAFQIKGIVRDFKKKKAVSTTIGNIIAICILVLESIFFLALGVGIGWKLFFS